MCGIFGAVHIADEDHLFADEAIRSTRHRGPDDTGLLKFRGGVFGQNRLSIIDLSPLGHQPMVREERAVLVFNGEIYNYRALRGELEAKGHVFRSRTDTEVILVGYLEWGDDVVDRIDGMFAIAIYDLAQRRLLLARDRSGKKPLFYSHDGEGIRFASEPKAIFASGVTPRVNVAQLSSLLTFGYVASPETMHAGVFEVPPASTLVLEKGREPKIRRYWRAPFAESSIHVPEEEAIRTVRRLVDAAVERRLEADVPLGAFLSGGIDSTIIVGAMARRMGRKVKTFSIGFKGDPRYDETHFARIAAKAFDTEHTEFALSPTSFDLIERLVRAHDGPFGDSSAVPTSIVSELTRKHVTVALSGDGGDELFAGYTRFLAAESLERVPLPFRQAMRVASRFVPQRGSPKSLHVRAHRFLSRASLPLAERMAMWNPFFGGELRQILRPELHKYADDPIRWADGIVAQSEGATPLARVLAHNFETYLPFDLLVKADRSSMMHSLEVRAPFLDTALIDYVARLPDTMKRKGTTTKWILKRAYNDLLPKEILSRGKMGFGVPLGAWFRGDLKDAMSDTLSGRARIFDYLEPAYVSRVVAEHHEGRVDHGQKLWLLLTLEIWLRSLSTVS